jgi:hypothetical protein
VLFKRPDCKKCSADEYTSTVYPCDLSNLLVAARTDASSSTTEITGSSDKTGLADAGSQRVLHNGSFEKMPCKSRF